MSLCLPSFEQWNDIQGGQPVILANEASTVFEIAHIYGKPEQIDRIPAFDPNIALKIGHYGCIIDTPVQQINASVNKPAGLFVGKSMTPVDVPATLLIDRHGKPCSQRSRLVKNEPGYCKIENGNSWRKYLEQKANESWDIWGIIADKDNDRLKLVLRGTVRQFL